MKHTSHIIPHKHSQMPQIEVESILSFIQVPCRKGRIYYPEFSGIVGTQKSLSLTRIIQHTENSIYRFSYVSFHSVFS